MKKYMSIALFLMLAVSGVAFAKDCCPGPCCDQSCCNHAK